MPTDKLTLEQFGQRLKARYPEYRDMSDAELARSVLAKYPQYNDMVQNATPVAVASHPRTQSDGPTYAGEIARGVGRGLKNLLTAPVALMTPHDTFGATREQEVKMGPTGRLLYNSVGDLADSLMNAEGSRQNAKNQGEGTAGQILAYSEQLPIVGGIVRKAEQAGPGPIKLSPQTLGAVTEGTTYAVAPVVAPKIAARVAPALESGGVNLLNRTVGVLKSDFSHGANPARGYLEGGGGPALSMRGLARRAQRVADRAGENLGNVYDTASRTGVRIPAERVSETLREPVQQLRELQAGPGGTGVNPSVDAYWDQLQPPIERARTSGGFTPRALFDEVKKPIAENTRWNDPTQFDMNKVRQENVGAVGGLLTDAVPQAAPLNRVYQGAVRLGRRAAQRAETGQPPLAQIGRRVIELGVGTAVGVGSGNPVVAAVPLLADTVPVKSTAATMLYRAGKALPAVSSAPVGRVIIPSLKGVDEEEPNQESEE